MLIGIGIFLVIIGLIFVWFYIPYSPLKTRFLKDIESLKNNAELKVQGRLFKKEDFLDKRELLGGNGGLESQTFSSN